MNGGERRERGKGSGGSKGGRTPYDIMKGKEVTVQSIGGTMFEGRFVDIWRDFIILSDCDVIGSRNIAHTDIIFIRLQRVQHIHTKANEIRVRRRFCPLIGKEIEIPDECKDNCEYLKEGKCTHPKKDI